MSEWDGRYGGNKVLDRGHTKICSQCGAAHGDDPELIGKPRTLDVEACPRCLKAGEDRKKVRTPELTLVRVGPALRKVEVGRRW